jgi:hypothetical protein
MSSAFFAMRTGGAGLSGCAGFVGGLLVASAATPSAQHQSIPLFLLICCVMISSCAVLLFALATKATPLESAMGGGIAGAALVAINAVEQGGLPVAMDHEAWAVILIVPFALSGGALIAARLARGLRSGAAARACKKAG